ncbi:hypothetical protein FisN_16Lh228 [Fistulifera solaris]|uniref:Uncharacterized protein n=1 Tax=Fistulifera solaris TaxID=1519565 RepID=A0A1Z5J6A8_FISSO|nr:hypothetical protein FisN_16Lh228 [Fistulifera solaris]|eukprot:GAX09535.1 hypothetical protein FisN_16Lh228 [Fistulifera solaris]
MVSKQGIFVWLGCSAPAWGWPQNRFVRPGASFIDSSASLQALQYRQGSVSEDDYSTPQILSQTILSRVVDTANGTVEHTEIVANPESLQVHQDRSLEDSIKLDVSIKTTNNLLDEESTKSQAEKSQFAWDIENKLKPKEEQVDSQMSISAQNFATEIKGHFQRVDWKKETTQRIGSDGDLSQTDTVLELEGDDEATSSTDEKASLDIPPSLRAKFFTRDIMTRWSAVKFDDRVKSKDNVVTKEGEKEALVVELSNDNFVKDVLKHKMSLQDASSASESTSFDSISDTISVDCIERPGIRLDNGVPFFVETRDESVFEPNEPEASVGANRLEIQPRAMDQESGSTIFDWSIPSTTFFENLKDQRQFELVGNVNKDAIKGAAVMGLMLSTVASGGLNLMVGGAAAALTSALALTKGVPGEIVRVTADSLWDVAVSTMEAAKTRQSSRLRRTSHIEQDESAGKTESVTKQQRSLVKRSGTSINFSNEEPFRRKLMAYRFMLEAKERQRAIAASERERLVPFFLGDGYFEDVPGIPSLSSASPLLVPVSQTSSSGSKSLDERVMPQRTINIQVALERLKKRLSLQRKAFSLEVELDVDDDTIKGAAISGLILATIGSGGLNLPVSAAVAVATSCMAMTKGAAGEVSRAIGDYAWEVVLSAKEVLTPERQQILRKDFAEGWLQFGLTLMEGTVSVANTTKEALSEHEKRIAKIEYERRMAMQKLRRSKREEVFHRNMLKMRLSLEKAERLRAEETRLYVEAIQRILRDRNQVLAQRQLMCYRFALEGAERARRAEDSRKALLLAEQIERENIKINVRRELMAYRLKLEEEQRKSLQMVEKVERERIRTQSRQAIMSRRFKHECEQREKRFKDIAQAQRLAEKVEREKKILKSRQIMMSYRFSLEDSQRAKSGKELPMSENLVEDAERELIWCSNVYYLIPGSLQNVGISQGCGLMRKYPESAFAGRSFAHRLGSGPQYQPSVKPFFKS